MSVRSRTSFKEASAITTTSFDLATIAATLQTTKLSLKFLSPEFAPYARRDEMLAPPDFLEDTVALAITFEASKCLFDALTFSNFDKYHVNITP